MEPVESTGTKYFAFISYSHADRGWGERVHHALETYRVPRRLVGTTGAMGRPVPRRIFPVFRDREELATSGDLGSVIRNALTGSGSLIVICSPRAAGSRWVNEEIRSFKRLGRSNRVLAIVVDGEPNATDKGDPASECFPAALRFTVESDGTISPIPAEPIAADARPHGDGWREARLKLIAGVLGVPFDALKRRDAIRRRWLMTTWVLIALMLMACGGGVWAWSNHRLARQRAEGIAAVERQRTQAATELEQQKKTAAERLTLQRTAQDAAAEEEAGRQSLLIGDAFTAARHLAAARGNGADGWQVRLMSAVALRRLEGLRAVFRHPGGEITCALLSPDGRLAAIGSTNGAISIWDTQRRLQKRRIDLPREAGELRELSWDALGRRLLARCADEHLILDVDHTDAGPIRLPLFPDANGAKPAPPGVASAAFVGDGEVVAALRENTVGVPVTLAILAAGDASERRVIPIGSGTPASVTVDRAGKTALVDWWSKEAGVAGKGLGTPHYTWIDLASGNVIADGGCDASTGCLISLHPSGEGLLIDRGKGKSEIRLKSGATVQVASDAESSSDGDRLYLGQIAWSSGGRFVLAADTRYKVVLVCDCNTGKVLRRITGEGVHTDRNDRYLFGTSDQDSVIVRSLSDGQILASFADRTGRKTNETFWSPRLALTPDGTALLLTDESDVARLWDWSNSGTESRVLTGPAGGEFKAAAFSPDGSVLVAGGSVRVDREDTKAVAHIYEVATGSRRTVLNEQQGFMLTGIGFTADGRHVVTASGLVTGAVRLWDVVTGTVAEELTAELPSPAGARRIGQDLAAYGRAHLVTAHGGVGSGRVWDAAGKKALADFAAFEAGPGKSLRQIGLAPDERHFFAVDNLGTVHLFATTDGKRVATLPATDGPVDPTACFSPDGKHLITVGENGRLSVWNWSEARVVARPNLNASPVNAARFSADGKYIAAAANDGHVHVWDLNTLSSEPGAELAELVPAPLPTDSADLGPPIDTSASGRLRMGMLDAAFGPAGEWLTSMDEHGWVYIWDLHRRQCVLRRKVPAERESKFVLAGGGRKLALVGAGANVEVLNLEAGNLPSVTDMKARIEGLTAADK